MGTVSFPGLGLEFHLNRVAFHIGSWPVYWYGIIIAAGFLLAVLYCCHAAKRFGIKQDDIIDMLFFAGPRSIVGARLYYILFYLDLYRREDGSLDFGAMVRIWDGGLAIYGGVIMAVVVLLVFCKVRKIRFLAFADLGVFGMLIGNHDPAKLWVNQMKRRARRVALVYPAGVPAAEKWLKAQKKSLEQEFAKTEEYALPKGTPAEETAELVASLKAREDLSEVRQPKAGK